MGVNWQDNSVYKDVKQSERESGISYAQQNALMNPNGVHSLGGIISVSLFNAVTGFCMQNAPDWIQSGGGGTDVSATTDVLKDFNNLTDKFRKETDTTKKREYAQQLQQLALENPDNKSIMNGYKMHKESINGCLNS